MSEDTRVWPGHSRDKCGCQFALWFTERFSPSEKGVTKWVHWLDIHGSKQFSIADDVDDAEAHPTEESARHYASFFGGRMMVARVPSTWCATNEVLAEW